jgi:glycerophosphoryl diester phosphodiesterase
MTKPLNIAHRGGAGLWPENTLFAFVSAAKAGYDGAELDVQLTRDKKLVVFHDFRLKPELCRDSSARWVRGRRASPLPLIHHLTLDELQSFDVGRPKPGTLYARRHRHLTPRDGERMPSLSDVITTVRAVKQDFRLFIELKTSLADPSLSAAPEAVGEATVAELRRMQFLDNAVVVGFDWRGLARVQKIEPALRCWFSTLRFSRIGARMVEHAGGVGWFCPVERARFRSVKQARALGLEFGVWTVNAARAMRAQIALGVDAICTDRPDRLQAILRASSADHSPSKRAVER